MILLLRPNDFELFRWETILNGVILSGVHCTAALRQVRLKAVYTVFRILTLSLLLVESF
jgi:hypothetical protein